LAICGFLSVVWWASKFARLAGLPHVILEIATGVVLGPKVLGLISADYTECEFQRHADCRPPADLHQRLAKGLSLGGHLDTAATADRCNAALYGVFPGGSGSGPGTGAGGAGGGADLGDNHSAGNRSASGTSHGAPLGSTTRPEQVTTTTVDMTHAPLTMPAVAQTSTTSLRLEATTAAIATTGLAVATATTTGSSAGPPLDWVDKVLEAANATDDPNETEALANDSQEPEVDDSAVGPAGDESLARRAPASSASAAGTAQRPAAAVGTQAHGRVLAGGHTLRYSSYEECLERTCEAEVRQRCDDSPDIFSLIGRAGVALMIFESGMRVGVVRAREAGPSVWFAALLGAALPCVSGSLLVYGFGKPFVPDGLAAGTSLAPTSVGIALRLLDEAGVLQESFTEAIIAAAFLDDLLTLIMFSVLFNLGGGGGGELDVARAAAAPLIGVAFMSVALCLARRFWPACVAGVIQPYAPSARDPRARRLARMRLTHDELLFFLMLCVFVLYALVTHLLGTFLWGCFLAGVSFAFLEPSGYAQQVWVKQTKRITTWMSRIFFACTVAFSIPVGELLSANALWKGTVLGVCGCLAPKVICAPWMEARWVIGCAMVGRAEFAYLIAIMAASSNLLDQETFSVVIWALLYATALAPFIFRAALGVHVRKHGLEYLADAVEDEEGEKAEDSAGEGKTLDGRHEGQCERHVCKDVEDGVCLDPIAKDLKDIHIAEHNPEHEFLTGGDGADAPREASGDALRVEGADGALRGSTARAAAADGGSRARREGRGRTRSGSRLTFNGRHPMQTRGFLCCLFFRKVIVD